MPKDPYDNRSRSTAQILGVAAPADTSFYSESMTAERLAEIMHQSDDMQEEVHKAVGLFLSKFDDLSQTEKTWMVFDGLAAVIASWGCSQTTVDKTVLDIPSTLNMAAIQLQHHFSEKQKELYERIGRFTH